MRTVLVVAAAVLGATALGFGLTLLRQRRRADGLARIAHTLGLTYTPAGHELLAEGLVTLPLLALASRARWCTLTNVLRGRSGGHEVVLCDLHYATGSPNDRREHRYTAAAFRVGEAGLPEFSLRAQPGAGLAGLIDPRGGPGRALAALLPGGGRLHRALAAAEARDADRTALPELAARYELRAADAPALRSRFGAELTELLLNERDPLLVDAAGDWLAVYRRGLVEPDAVPAFLGLAGRVADLLTR